MPLLGPGPQCARSAGPAQASGPSGGTLARSRGGSACSVSSRDGRYQSPTQWPRGRLPAPARTRREARGGALRRTLPCRLEPSRRTSGPVGVGHDFRPAHIFSTLPYGHRRSAVLFGDGNRLLLRLTARARRYGAQRGVAAPALFSLSDGRGDGGDGESRTGILIKDRGTTAAPGASDDRDRGPPVSEPAPRRRAAAAASTGAMQTGPDGVAELLQRAAAVGAQPCQRRVERRAAGVTAHMGQVGPVARVGGEGGELEGGGRGKGLRRLGRAESLRL